jgi:4-hydroxy-tetrahydrodipicolinate synthase
MIDGSYVALVTPFKNNEVDYTALENLIEFHLNNSTDGILFCGTTGESPALAGDEKEQLVRFGLQKINKSVPVMMGTGTNNLHHTISATTKAQQMGIDYALVITPYYNKPNQEGLYRFFSTVAENCDIPLVIYNVPGRTGVNITSDTTLRLAHHHKNIVGIKEASGNLVQLSKIVKDAPEGFSVLSGEDALNLPILSCGGSGVVSVTANLVPKKMHDLVAFYQKGKFEKALAIHQELIRLNSVLFIDTNPIPVKEALHMMGLIEQEIRLPLYYLSEKNRDILAEVLQSYNLVQETD